MPLLIVNLMRRGRYFATMAMFNYPPTASPLKRDCESRSCACIGSPCLSRCVHGASIGELVMAEKGLGGFRRLLAPHQDPNKKCFDLAAQVGPLC